VLAAVAPGLAQQPADKAKAEEHLRKGDQLALEGKLGPARAAYERALAAGADLSNDYVRARNLGMVYLNGAPRDFARAARWLELASKLRPSADDTRLLLAQALAWSGKHEAAIEHYRALARKSPDTAEYASGLGNTLYWAGKNDEAFAAYDRYLERKPTHLAMRLEYARLLSYARRLPEATLQYQTVLQADPNNVQAQVGLAKIASWQDDLKGALERYNKILRHHPNLYDAIVGKAYTLYWMGRNAEAAALFQQALKRNPRDKEVQATLKEMGATAEAKKPAQPAVAAAPPADTKPAAAQLAESRPAETAPAATAAAAALQPDTFDTHQKAPARNAITVMMEQAQAAANANNYAGAVHLYHEVLAKEPNNTAALIQLARVLSWSRNFEQSAATYDKLLQLEPGNAQARLERARVLSWGQNYEASIEEYRSLIREAEVAQSQARPQPVETAKAPEPVERAAPEIAAAAPAPAIDLTATRLELARVLAWSKRYDESLAQFNQLLPPEQKPEVKDKPILIEKARVLSYSRNYEEAVKTYDVALALDAADIEARLGKGQTLYWWGRLDQAAAVLRPLMQVEALAPETKTTTVFTLAAVEHGRGKDSTALSLLNSAGENSDAKLLRTNIQQGMRPVLRFTFGWQNDQEEPASPSTLPTTVIRALRYSTSFSFNVHPEARMTVSNTVMTGTTSNGLLGKHGSGALAYETMVKIDWRARSWLRLLAGVGEGSVGAGSTCDLQVVFPCASPAGERTHHFVFDIRPTITKGQWRLEFEAGRHIADWTPLSVHDNVLRTRFGIATSYNWAGRVLTGAEYWHSRYAIESPQLDPALARNKYGTDADGIAVYITPTWYRGEHVRVDGGVRYEWFSFDQGALRLQLPPPAGIASGGFFAPREYQRVAGTGRVVYEHGRFRGDLHGSFGPQRVKGFEALSPPAPEWGTTGTLGAEISLNLGRFRPFLAYDWFSTATAAGPGQVGNGSYRSHSLVGGFTIRF